MSPGYATSFGRGLFGNSREKRRGWPARAIACGIAACCFAALLSGARAHQHKAARTGPEMPVNFTVRGVSVDYGTQAPDRIPCASVMLVPEESARIPENLLATLEGHLISRGL